MDTRTHIKKKSGNTKKPNWDAVYKCVTTLVAIAGLGFAVYQYHANSVQSRLERERQERQTRRDNLTKLYADASRVATTFSAVSDRETALHAKDEFFSILGQVNVLGDTSVAGEMAKFAEEIKKWNDVNTNPQFFTPPYRYQRAGISIFDQLSTELSKVIQVWLRTSDSNQTTTHNIQHRLRG